MHRDIKPANIMVGPFGEVMVMDWGIAKRVGEGEVPTFGPGSIKPLPERLAGTHVGSVIGTPAYMSPEQVRGDIETLDARSDIYSLCVMYHELLCLRHYLADQSSLEEVMVGVLATVPKHPSFIPNPHQTAVPADLGWIVMAGLAKDPLDRYPSVEALLTRLPKRSEGEIRVQCPITLTKRITMTWSRFIDAHPLGALITLGISVLFVIGGGRHRTAGLVRAFMTEPEPLPIASNGVVASGNTTGRISNTAWRADAALMQRRCSADAAPMQRRCLVDHIARK